MSPELPDERAKRFARRLDWNLLRTFMFIFEAGGITAAADCLGRQQPSVSNALKRLETTVGAQLIERGPNHFRITSAGNRLYQECVEIYGSILRLGDELQDVSDDIDGHINLVMASHVVSPHLDAALSNFHRENQKATLGIEISSSPEAIERIRHRSASFAICLMQEESTTLKHEVLYREFFGLYCGPTHPLFGKKNLTIKDLEGQLSVSFKTEQASNALRPVALMRAEAKLDDRVVGISSNLEEIRRMIVAGFGIGPLPVHVVKRDVSDGLLWQLPPYEKLPAINVHLVYNPETRLNRAEKCLLELLLKEIKTIPFRDRTFDRN